MVLLWTDVQPYGPAIQLLAAVDDMGQARRLAKEADVPPPGKFNRLHRSDELVDVALSHPGELLWRADEHPTHRDGFEDKPWRLGASAVRNYRDADVARYHSTVAAARERRRRRR